MRKIVEDGDGYRAPWGPKLSPVAWIEDIKIPGPWLIQDVTGWKFSDIHAVISENQISDAWIDYMDCGTHRVIMIWKVTDEGA